jgi:predicted secreted protein
VEFIIRTKDREQKIGLELMTSNIVKIIKQVIQTVIITYVLGCTWYFISAQLNGDEDDSATFISTFNLD